MMTRKIKGVDYRYLVMVQGTFGTKRFKGKKKWFFNKEKAEKYCEHLDRNSKQYEFWDTQRDVL